MLISRLIVLSLAMSSGYIQSLNAAEKFQLPSAYTPLKHVDINGNGIPDRVVATYFTRPISVLDIQRAPDGSRLPNINCKTLPSVSVRYTMYADGRKNGKVIFEENSANVVGGEWLQRIEIGKDLNRDGRKDLVFYMGNDSNEEMTYLLQKPGGFKAITAGEYPVPRYAINARRSLVSFDQKVLAKWDRATETWQGNQHGWLVGDCVAIRSSPDLQSKIVGVGFDRNLVSVNQTTPVGDWIAIDRGNGLKGWISKQSFSASAPVRWFK
jgi:hypothetical protein